MKIQKEKLPTSSSVAKLAGVSQSAVSRCFTKGASISNRTKLRVIEAAKKLGYKPQSFSTNSLNLDEGGLVGVILPYITNRYYPEVLTELHEALRISGYRILLITTDSDEELDDNLIQPYLKERLVAIVSATKPTDEFVENCLTKKIQLIAFNRNWKIPTLSSVACDHRYGGEEAAEHFINNEHTNIGIIEGPTGSFVSNERCKGFKNYLKNLKKIKLYQERGNFTYEGGSESTKKLLKNNITALFCADDIMAFGCLDYIKENTKLNIPKEIEIIGYDDISTANWYSYNLTTIRQPIRQMSKLVTQIIDENIKDPEFEPVNHVIQGKFIYRNTTR
jgi:DNA-binding LacI/PurR family transcriptional regulator